MVCQSGLRSSAVIERLVAAGYSPSHLYNLDHGMNDWAGPISV
jgi:rhodanese-related sulfurtransferase